MDKPSLSCLKNETRNEALHCQLPQDTASVGAPQGRGHLLEISENNSTERVEVHINMETFPREKSKCSLFVLEL